MFSDIKNYVLKSIQEFLDENNLSGKLLEKISINQSERADLTTNAAIIIGKICRISIDGIAEQLVEKISNNKSIEKIEELNGFINITLDKSVFFNSIVDSIQSRDRYGFQKDKKSKINIEYVSVNPTGFLHMGHARVAIFGDALANLLIANGYHVTKEYYINDAGQQTHELTESILHHYCNIAKYEHNFKIIYGDDKLKNIAQKIYEGYSSYFKEDDLQNNSEYEYKTNETDYKILHHQICEESLKKHDIFNFVRSYAILEIMELIRKDLKDINIEHDIFFSEKYIHNIKAIEKSIDELNKKGYVKYSNIESKFTEKGEASNKELLVFNLSKIDSSKQDCPLKKANGEYTYFAADIAYHMNKISRGFNKMIDIWGADHDSHIHRLKSAINILNPECDLNIMSAQMLNIINNGQAVKMSKRKGTSVTIRDMLKEIPANVIRFNMLQKSINSHFNFDIEESLKTSEENHLFYINYAYSRINSVFKKAKEVFKNKCSDEIYDMLFFDGNIVEKDLVTYLQYLKCDKEPLKLIQSWPAILKQCANDCNIHLICSFLYKIAKSLHSMWNKGTKDLEERFILEEDVNLSISRLILLKSISNTISSGSKILGVELQNEMR